VKLRVPGLSPYSGSSNVGHVWIGNPKEGGTRTFFREYFHEIALPAFRANASIQGLLEVVHSKKGKRKMQAQQASTSDAADMPELKSDDPAASASDDCDGVLTQRSLSLLAFDGEIAQVQEATSEILQPELNAVLLPA
jgi:hypothetical protein